jgi:hypothetical protein
LTIRFPQIVDFPESTCPIKTRLQGYRVVSTSSKVASFMATD